MAADDTLRLISTDYAAQREALLNRVRARWSGVWSDFTSNNVAMMLVDLMAHAVSTQAYTLNHVAADMFVPTMMTREAAVRFAALAGYKLRGPQPASLLCEAQLRTAAPGPSDQPYLKLQKGTLIRVGDLLTPFELVNDYYIYGGQTSPASRVVSFDAAGSGNSVVSTNVKTVNGQGYVDLADPTVDAGLYVSPGQALRRPGDDEFFTVTAVESPGLLDARSRIYIEPAWSGNSTDATELGAIEVVERRVEFSQGQSVLDRFVASSVQASQLFKLTKGPVIHGSTSVSVNEDPWSEVNSIAVSSGKSYEVVTTSSGDVLVKFGDGVFGELLPADAVVEVSYRVGGGSAGNVPVNTVSTSLTGFVVGLQNPVTVYVTNASSPGQGGRDPESLEEARLSIPQHIVTNDRAVTLEDWQTLAMGYSHPQHGAVAYARASVNAENSFLEGNLVYIHAWATGPSGSLLPLSPAMKEALKDYLESKAVGTDYPVLVDGSARPVPLAVRFKSSPGYEVHDVAVQLSNKVKDVIRLLRPGSVLVYSDLVRSLDEVEGVSSVDIATPRGDLSPSSPSDLFTSPQDGYRYSLRRSYASTKTVDVDGDPVSVGRYIVQFPVWPLAAWSFKLYLGLSELTVIPDTAAGYARLFGPGLLQDDNDEARSRVNLLTGQGEVYLDGPQGELAFSLSPIHGYSRERQVDVFVGYSGTNSADKRAEIKAAIKAWAAGMSVGRSLFAKTVPGVSTSLVSVSTVVKSISGVSTVNRVALDNPSNLDDRVNAGATELLTIGDVIINNKIS